MLQEAPQCGWVNMPWMWETGPDHLGCVFRCTCISSKLIKVVLELSSTSKKCTALNNCQSCIKKKELFLVQWRKVLQKKLFSKFRVSFQLFILVKLSRALLLLFSCSVVSDSLRPHGLQHTRLPCCSPTPGACSNSELNSILMEDHTQFAFLMVVVLYIMNR